ncbi:MAG: TIGR03936 family radical SAM-associated protein [Planctomycetota bacterium]
MISKVLLQFSKRGEMRFVSNLDVQRVFEQAFRRAGIPMRFSEGYHPRPRMSMGPALPLGIESDCESLRLQLQEPVPPEELAERLNANLPEGLEVRVDPSDRLPSGEDQAIEEYDISLPGGPDSLEAARRRLGESPLELVRETPKGRRIEVALHRDLIEVSNDGTSLRITLRTGPGHARIRDVLDAIGHPLGGTAPPRVRKLRVEPADRVAGEADNASP